MQPEFPGDIPVQQLLPLFYNKYDLPADGGLNDATVKVVFYKKICAYIPNIGARRKAILKHDVHHLVTGYKTDFKGETEISAWEIGSGCKKYWAALMLDAWGMMTGFIFNIPGIFRAFVRGRRTKNLYDNAIDERQLLTMTIDEIRAKLGLKNDSPGKATFKEVISFITWVVAGGLYSLLSMALIPVLIIYSFIIVTFNKNNIK